MRPFYGVLAAFLVSCVAFGMPLASAVSAFALGSLSGFLGIIWIVLGAMFLYAMTVITGKFESKSWGAICSRAMREGTLRASQGLVLFGLDVEAMQHAVHRRRHQHADAGEQCDTAVERVQRREYLAGIRV